MSLNVNPEIKDIYYRYKMPKLMTKIEGKGNGIKTVITNITEIGKAIYRKPSYPIKYFGMELGTQTIIAANTKRYVVNGNHDATKLQELLYTFIKKFVLCLKCGNPETFLTVKKKSGNVTTKCKACGNTNMLDTKHKLTQYIFKNPPETEIEGAAISTKTTENNGDAKDAENLEEMTSDLKSDNVTESMIEEAENKLKELCVGEEQKTDFNQFRSQKECIYDFFKMVTEKFKEGKILLESKEIRNKAKQLKLKEGCIMVLMEIIFVNPRTILSDIEKYKSIFHLFTREKSSSKDKFQNYLIAGMMKLVENYNLASESCHLLKSFYDNDIIEEEIIMNWFEKGVRFHLLSIFILQKLETWGGRIISIKTSNFLI